MRTFPRLVRSTSVSASAVLIAGGLVSLASAAFADTAPNGVVAYSAWDEDLNYDIYTIDPANPDEPPKQLTTDGRYNGNPDWSPDGTKIAFDGWGTHFGPRIQVMDANPGTDDQVVLTEPCADEFDCYGDFQPSWSPDGTRIAFVSSRPNADGTDNWSYEIYVMDATGEVDLPPATRLTTDPLPEFGGGIEDSQVTWSPDGTRIAFMSEGRGDDADSCDLWVMDSVDRDGDGFGDDLERLTFDEDFNCDAFGSMSPQWAPDSNLIAFASFRSNNSEIWVVNADDTSDLRNATQAPTSYEDQPSWSPDGTQIIFRSDRSGEYELWSVPVPDPAARVQAPPGTQLTDDGMDKSEPDWGAARGSLPSTRTLTVAEHRHGTVRTANLAKINCGKDCVATFVRGRSVTLTVVPKPGYVFDRWTGKCTGHADTCRVRLTKSAQVGARFTATA